MKYISSLYISKIYGSVLGKIIGVRVGNPLEFVRENGHILTSEELQKKYPYISTYIDKERTIYADDDTNGFVFFAKIFERINRVSELTPELAAKIILNYATENRGFFWWDKSTESKVFHNLIKGVSPKKSGSYDYIGNSADTVGGQIFYDAVGIIFGGNPAEAARCAGLIASVIHNGEGAIGGSFISACISAAFYEDSVEKIIDTALALIPVDSEYAKMVRNIVDFYHKVPYEWTACQHYIEDNYTGHTAWDYGAHIIMSLLYGNGNFSYSMEICLKSGGDTDCNCGNIGAILGAMHGHEKISYNNWIKPMNDVLYCSSTVPYENEVSITQFTAYLIKLFAKFNGYAVPDYIKIASELSNFSFVFPYSYQNFHILMFRNGEKMKDLVNDGNMWVSSKEVNAPSGSPYTLKIWADSVKAKDCLRVYRWFNIGKFDNIKYEPTSCTKIYSGQKISVNVMTRYNTADMKVRLFAYSSIENKAGRQAESPLTKSSFIRLEPYKWYTLKLIPDEIQSFYDCINIEMIMSKDSYYNNGYDGIDLYIDDFRISGNPEYSISFKDNKNLINNNHHYPLFKNFNVCYGEAYEGCNGLEYVRFHSGYPKSHIERSHWQQLSYDNKFALAFTGNYIDNCTIYCNMSILPTEDEYNDYNNNASLLTFAVKGANEHYAAGFYNGKIAILKSKDTPGKYKELVSQEYNYDITKRYCFEVILTDGFIDFNIYESDGSNDITEKNLCFETDTELLKGCIGFAGIGNGITVYEYGII